MSSHRLVTFEYMRRFSQLRAGQTDARSGAIEVKIKKLDGELARYKEQMSKLRNGPGKVSPYRRFSA